MKTHPISYCQFFDFLCHETPTYFDCFAEDFLPSTVISYSSKSSLGMPNFVKIKIESLEILEFLEIVEIEFVEFVEDVVGILRNTIVRVLIRVIAMTVRVPNAMILNKN